MIGPNTAGLVTPGECFVGFMPAFNPRIFAPGAVGVISRSGSLGTLACLEIVRAGLGISRLHRHRRRSDARHHDARRAGPARPRPAHRGGRADRRDRRRDGGGGGRLRRGMAKPVAAFIAGAAAPPGRRMGHAGAIVTGSRGSYEAKRRALEAAGVEVLATPDRDRPGLRQRLDVAAARGGTDDAARRSAAEPGRADHQGLAGAGRRAAARARSGGRAGTCCARTCRCRWPCSRPRRSPTTAAGCAASSSSFDVRLCPHGKTTMAPQLFARQLADGAWGITVATVQQLMVCRRFGVPRVLLANQLIGREAIRTVIAELEADPGFELLCVVDSLAGVAGAARGARRPSARAAVRGPARGRRRRRPHRLPQRRGRARGGARGRRGAGAGAGRGRGLRGRDGRRHRRRRAQGRGVPRASWSRSRAPAPGSTCSRRAR